MLCHQARLNKLKCQTRQIGSIVVCHIDRLVRFVGTGQVKYVVSGQVRYVGSGQVRYVGSGQIRKAKSDQVKC